MTKRKKICTIGGGTGNFVVLQGLKDYAIDLSAIVTMSDDGGSTGVLRDELGVLPAGDSRQCIVALSNSSKLMRDIMNYRFDNGLLKGHNFGNLFLSALEKVSGSFERAIDEVGKILNMKGSVIPVTTDNVNLQMTLNDQTLLMGEKNIYESDKIIQGYKKIELYPAAKANQKAIAAIWDADVIVLGPGGLYTSLISNLLVENIPQAIQESKAIKIFVINLMNRVGQTDGFKVQDYLREVNQYFLKDPFDYIIVNSEKISPKLLSLYKDQGEIVENDCFESRVYQTSLLGTFQKRDPNDLINRNLIRHDSKKLSLAIIKLLNQKRLHAVNL